MQPSKSPSRALPFFALVALASVGTLAFTSGASFSRSAPSVPPLVAVVNVEQVVNDATETKSRNTSLEAKYKAEAEALKAIEAQLASLDTEIKQLPPTDRAGRRQRLLQGAKLEANLKATSQFLSVNRDEERGDILRDVYGKALQTIETYAQQNNIALVIMDDSVAPLPEVAAMNAMNAAIVQRRVLFASKSQLDITGDVLTKMNNDFAAGGGKAPAEKPADKKKK